MFLSLHLFTLIFGFLLSLTVQSLPLSANEAREPTLADKLTTSIHQNENTPGHPILAERTKSPGGLFGANGIPDLADLDQTSIPDCGLISVLGALVALDPKYITDLIQYSGNPTTIRAVMFKLHQSGTLKNDYQTIFKARLSEDRSDAKEGWWVGGIEQAVRQAGHDISLSPDQALEMITGQKAKYMYLNTGQNPPSGAMSKEDVWTLLVDHAEFTPIILQSWTPVPDQPSTVPKKLQEQHAFWVVSAKIDGARLITLWNPHGENEVHNFDEIWSDCYTLYSFAGLNF